MKQDLVAMFADFHGENIPLWLISVRHSESLNMGLGRDATVSNVTSRSQVTVTCR